MNKNKLKDPIPDTNDREKLAEFWDTHSIADYMDELTLVDPKHVYVAPNLSEIVLSLDPETSSKLMKVGRKKRIDPITLARQWITDLVNKELKHSTSGI
ncbi:MAG TPA: hypothetical protein VJL83_04260 [Patescibacteria group bacterium]|nr:hypothetical protein [Patescibacteria group bacterium]